MVERPDDTTTPSFRMRSASLMGCGIRFYDLERALPDIIIATQWISLLFVPILPLRRARCRRGILSQPLPDLDDSLVLVECRREPLSVGGVIVTYVSALAALLATLGPIALLIWMTDGRAARVWETVVLFAFVLLTVGLMIWQEVRVKRFIEQTLSLEEQQRTEEAQRTQLDVARSRWESRHVLPEWLFLIVAAIGLVPGVAVGVWWGWQDGNLLAVLGLASAALLAGLLWCLDRLLVWDRDRQNPHEVDGE